MARRYDHSREELREMILNETQRQVAAVGVQKISVRKIAKEIGYSVGTIYNFFADLDDLIMQLNGTTLNALKTALTKSIVNGSVEEKLLQLADIYIDFTRDNINLWNCVFEHRLLPGREQPDWYQEKVEHLLRLIEEVISPLYSNADKSTCHQSAWVLWCSFHGICSLSNMEQDDNAAKTAARNLSYLLISNYLSGIRKERS